MKTVFVVLAVVLVCAFVAPAMAQTVHVDHRNVIFVGGTDSDDTVVLKQYRVDGVAEGVTIKINGVDYGDWPTAERDGITVRGYDGNDRINLRHVTTEVFFLDLHPDFEITITGDGGNDKIHGSEGHDVIRGNDGNDRIFGLAGNDILLGGEGNDIIAGGAGHDVIEGNGGRKDQLKGGCGNDKIADKDGFRLASGGDGEDKLYLTFPDDYVTPRWDVIIEGGYDADLIEIYNNSPMLLELLIDGDIPFGYDNEGDILYTHGSWDEALTVSHVESVTHF